MAFPSRRPALCGPGEAGSDSLSKTEDHHTVSSSVGVPRSLFRP